MITKLIIILSILSLISLMFFGMRWIYKSARKFYLESDEIENKIREGDEETKEILLEQLINLSKKSFHRTTGERIIQLAKMYEVKYNTRILKN